MRDGPTLSACLVVKNEELFLDACLASLRNVVDELVVVDTGSVDRTIEIAERWADIVTREPWPGDLGQAHDLPVAHASGDWILTLDGDERLDPAGAAGFAALLRNTAHDGFILPVRNYLFHPGPGFRPADPFDPMTHGARCWQPSQNIRLFRNDPRFRHRGHLHQSPVTSIQAAGGTIGTCACVIHHYGWLRTDRDKSAFYGALLERDAAASPHDPQVHLELAFARRVEGDDAGATRACHRAIELGETSRGWAELGTLRFGQCRFAEAVACHQRSLADWADTTFLERADVLIELAECLGALGQTGRAEAEWRRALALRPRDPRVLNGLASLLFLKGEADEAWALSASALAQYPGLPGPWHGRGLGHFVAGDLTRAAEDFHTSLDIETSNPLVHYNLALINARNGDEAAAAEMLDTALRTGGRALLPASIRALQPGVTATALPDVPAGHAAVSVIPDLAGGGALAASMVCEAIGASRPQVILTGSRGRFTGEDHHRLVADLDVPVIEVAGTGDLRDAIEALRPAVVVNHWWPSAAFKPLCRVGDERLILNSTSPVPLPPGYDVYVTLSDFQAAYQAHIPTERVVRIPNGIDLAVADAAVPDPTLWRQGLSDRTVRIAMLSRLDPDKFIARLPDCLDGLDPGRVEVTVAGRGARRWECAGELTRRGMEGWVRFIGPIAQSHVARFLAGADIGLHLTETHQESHPFAIMQMMAAGLPIVAQPRGALPEMVDHGQTGFLDSDPAEIARALGWLAENPGARAEFGAEARRRIAPFTAQAFHTAWRDLIERTVAEVPQGRQTCQSCPDAPDP